MCTKIGGADVQFMNKMYEQSVCKAEIQRNENDLSYRLHEPDTLYAFRMEKMSKFNTVKNKIIFIKCAQNKRCISSMYEQSLGKVWI